MARGVHPKKEVRKAIKELRSAGWAIEVAVGGHAHRWGTATCPHQHLGGSDEATCCVRVIYGTPHNQYDEANRLRRALRKCQNSLARSDQEHMDD